MSEATFDPTIYNTSKNTSFDTVLNKRFSRRNVLSSGSGIAAMAAFSSMALSGCGGSNSSSPANPAVGEVLEPTVTELGFQSINGAKLDAVAVAPGYKAQVLAPWGTPLNDNAQEWKADGTNTAQDQLNAVGMNHDGMRYFPINGSDTDGLLVMNHEYINTKHLHPNGPTFETIDGVEMRTLVEEVRKEIYAHGVTVARITKTDGVWQVIKNDPLNRRYTGATEMDISGPMFMSQALTTKYSPDGRVARGTLNNCGNGYTPWGTYLTCEENWPGYFVNTGEQTADQQRIGLGDVATRYGWDHVAGDPTEIDDEFARFNVVPSAQSASQDYRNEANGHGYIVEIDPFTNSRAVKRTALGRFRHEGCEPGRAIAGQPIVFYSGHDARFEYIYKFESAALWDPADANASDKLAIGSKYMDAGTLYVAQFNEDGQGVWLPLTPETATTDGTLADTFPTQADIILNTAGAADLLGATPMDRPEWCAVDPLTGTAYMTLTNNTRRTENTNIANPRLNNKFGHIIRWDEQADNTFTWDIFVFGSPANGDADTNKSGLTDLNQFASPDGLVFDSRGILWIQTDNGASEVKDITNDQMLAVIPSVVNEAEGEQKSFINTTNQAELKRFFVGPNGCEVTGLAFNDSNTTFFANIQHPGNWPLSNDATEMTPEGTTIRARSATVVIEKIDGGAIGE